MPKMRIACSTFSFDKDFKARKIDLPGFMAACGAMGIDAVELNGGYLAQDPASPQELKALAVRWALDICALAIETVVYVPDEDAADAYQRKMLEWLTVCVELGIPLLRVNTAQPENGMHQLPATVREEQVYAWAVGAFREVARAARAKGISLAVENHFGLTRTSAETLRFIKAVGEPNVGVNIDTGNFWDDIFLVKDTVARHGDLAGLVPFEDPYAGIRRLAPHMNFSHCKVFGLSADRLNDLALDYGRILRIYVEAGYHGYLSLENFTDGPPAEVVSGGVEMLRRQLTRSLAR